MISSSLHPDWSSEVFCIVFLVIGGVLGAEAEKRDVWGCWNMQWWRWRICCCSRVRSWSVSFMSNLNISFILFFFFWISFSIVGFVGVGHRESCNSWEALWHECTRFQLWKQTPLFLLGIWVDSPGSSGVGSLMHMPSLPCSDEQ